MLYFKPALNLNFSEKQILPFLLSLCLFLSSSWASAGLIGVYELPKQNRQMVMEYQDDENIRIQVEEDFYLLVSGGKMYMVNGDSITDVKAFRDRIRSWGITKFMEKRAEKRMKKMPNNQNLVKTDRSETLAGIKGIVWEAHVSDPETQEKEIKEIVITDDARMVALKLAMRKISQAQESEQTPENFKKMRNNMQSVFGDDVAILRYNDRFKLGSLKEADIDPERFQLPNQMEIRSLPKISDLTQIFSLMASLSED